MRRMRSERSIETRAAGGGSAEKRTFLSGVFLLSVSTVLVKLVGLVYKIPMLSYLGAEGMGYFNSAYEIYALFCIVATAGLPVALSVLIAAELEKGNGSHVGKIFRVALAAFLTVGAAGTAVMLGCSGLFCRLIQSEGARLSILSVAPTVFLICISSALRGYFQGYGNMLPTALSQLIEAIGKLGFGLLLANAARRAGSDTPTVAAAAGAGLSLGTLASTLYLIVEAVRKAPRMRVAASADSEAVADPGESRSVGRSLAKLAVPITLGASAVSLTKLIDMTMILRRLQAIGMTEALANEAYGSYTTLALSVFGLIPTLVNSVALPLVPMLSAAIVAGDRERQAGLIRFSFRLTALFSIPSALGIAVFSGPILRLLFPAEPEAVAFAAPLLSMLGVSVFLSCMITATNSVLHAYRSVNLPILALLAGAAVKIVSAYWLIGTPQIGILGAPVSTFLCNAVVVVLNLIFVGRRCPADSMWGVFLRPLATSGASVGISYGTYLLMRTHFGETFPVTASALGLTVLLYLLFSLLSGGIGEEDLNALPMGKPAAHFLSRLHLIPKRKEG